LTSEIHDIFKEPYYVDASLVQEFAIQQSLAGQTNIFSELIKLLKSPTIVTMLAVIAVCALIAAGLSGAAYYDLHNKEFCINGINNVLQV